MTLQTSLRRRTSRHIRPIFGTWGPRRGFFCRAEASFRVNAQQRAVFGAHNVMTPALYAALLLSPQATSIDRYVQANLRDASFTARVERSTPAELRKINRDFAASYRFTSMNVQMKEPFKLRLTTTVEDMDVTFVMNGARRVVRTDRGLGTNENLANSPGKRQTAFDFGLLTPGLFDDFFTARFIRMDRTTGNAVFDVTYVKPKFDDTSRHRIWVDTTRKIVTKREWYNQQDVLMAIFTYENHQQVNGVWLPTRLTVRNAEGKFAGSTVYSNLRVNTGLSDDLFRVR